MPNRYANLIASEKIKDEYQKINDGFAKVEQEMDSIEVGSANITDGSVTEPKIATNAVTAGKIASNAVTNPKISTNAVTTDKINNSSVTADKLASNAVTEPKIAAGAVSTAKVADSAVTAPKLASNAVTDPKIANDAITRDKIRSQAVSSDKIQDYAVNRFKIQDGAVGTDQLGEGAVEDYNLADNAVATAHIKNGVVNADKLANGAVTGDKLAAPVKTKLDGIAAGAEVNQNAFSRVNNVNATSKTDTITINGGTGITVTTNPTTKEVNITATGTATPGAHASSHLSGGSDPLPLATPTASGLMGAADKAAITTLQEEVQALEAATKESATLTRTLKQGQEIIDADQPSPASVVVLGQTRYNLLGTAGGCEDLSLFSRSSTGTVELSSTIKRSGNNSLKFVVNNEQVNALRQYNQPLDPTKQYLFGLWVYIESFVSGSLRFTLRDHTSNAAVRYQAAGLNTSLIGVWQFIYIKVPTGHTIVGDGYRLVIGSPDNVTTATFHVDEIRLLEIPATEAAAIGTTINGEDVDRVVPYNDGMQSARGLELTVKGRNQVPPLQQVGLPTNSSTTSAEILEPYKFKLTAGANTGNVYIRIPVVPNQNYAFSFEAAGTGNPSGAVYNDQATIPLRDYGDSPRTFNSGNNTVVRLYMRISANSSAIFSNPMLVLGDASALPPSFVAQKDQTHIADVTLRSIGSLRDQYNAASGKAFKLFGEVRLSDLEFSSITTTPANVDYIRYVKPADMITSPLTLMDSIVEGMLHVFGSSDNVSNIGRYSNIAITHSLVFIVAKGTTRAQFEAATNMSAKIIYRLANPVSETVASPSGLTLQPGSNIVEIRTGVVRREKANPSASTNAYHINNSTRPGTMLNHSAGVILGIYRSAERDDKWSVSLDVNGQQRASIPTADYDPNVDYYVDYIVLDCHSYTTAVSEASVTYAANHATILGWLTEQQARILAHLDKLDWEQILDEAHLENVRRDQEDHANATGVHGAVSAPTASRLIIRDSNGRAQVATPSAAGDIARKDTVDNAVGTLANLQTTAKTNVVAAVNELFTSASNGKQAIADAITGKGLPASANPSFTDLATVIQSEMIPRPGIVWQSNAGLGDRFSSICYAQSIFVAVSNGFASNGPVVMTSPDGINWTPRTAPGEGFWQSVCYGNGLFVAVGAGPFAGGATTVITSPDGINWTLRSAYSANWSEICYGNGQFVAVSGSAHNGNNVMTSPNGINWTMRTTPSGNSWSGVCYGNGMYVAVSHNNNDIGRRLMTSPDGITWTLRSAVSNSQWVDVIYGNGLFVAVSSSGNSNGVMTSPNGINWTARATNNNSWRCVEYANGLYVACSYTGNGNRVMTSPDAVNWTVRQSAANNSWGDLCFGEGKFVAVAYDGNSNYVMISGLV